MTTRLNHQLDNVVCLSAAMGGIKQTTIALAAGNRRHNADLIAIAQSGVFAL